MAALLTSIREVSLEVLDNLKQAQIDGVDAFISDEDTPPIY